VPQADDRIDDREGRRAGTELVRELSVDLELVQRKALKIGEGRIARPEIVERGSDAQLPQAFQDARRLLEIADQDPLGDLELEKVRGKPRVLEGSWRY
jgi:hypothetical protein